MALGVFISGLDFSIVAAQSNDAKLKCSLPVSFKSLTE